MRDITLESSGRRLAARIFAPPGDPRDRPAVLFLHGLDSQQDGYAPRARLLVEGIEAVCLTLDLSGHGASEGDLPKLTPKEHLADALAGYDRLVSEAGVDPSRIGMCGASYGGYVASLAVARRPVARLLLRAPALFDDRLFDAPLARRRDFVGPPNAESVLMSLGSYDGEVMVLEGENDTVVTHDVIETYLRAIRRPTHRTIPGATHELSQPAWRQAFLDAILEWFRQM